MPRPAPALPARGAPARRPVPLALLALTALALPVLAAAPSSAAPAAAAATRAVSVFPTDALTVADPAQLTGRRVDLPLPDCEERRTDCHTVRLLNGLDGFDLDPRLAVQFDADVDPSAVAANMRVRRAGGGFTTGVDRVVYDPDSHTVYAHPQRQLAPGTEHVLQVQGSRGVPAARSTFTTLSATDGLLDMRRQLDSGEAYEDAGLEPDERRLEVDAVVPAAGTTLSYVADLGDTEAPPAAVPDVSGTGAGSYVFGSFRAPQWINRRAFIPQVPTGTDGPEVDRAERLGFVMILPAGRRPRAAGRSRCSATASPAPRRTCSSPPRRTPPAGWRRSPPTSSATASARQQVAGHDGERHAGAPRVRPRRRPGPRRHDHQHRGLSTALQPSR